MRERKICAHCGRPFEWRKKWQNCWDEVRYCSDKCRRSRKRSTHAELESAILELLSQRESGSSICPSEVARLSFPDNWRDHMEDVRNAARRLAGDGKIEVTQGGKVVDPGLAKGPIRYRLKQSQQ